MTQRIVIIGPAWPLRGGGMTTFNHRLAKEMNDRGYDCSIVSFSLQYPSVFFPGKTQYSDEPAPEGICIRSIINSINPFNWMKTGNRIRKEKPDILVVRFWIPFMGPALGTILRLVKKNKHTRIICIADNIIPHEHRPGDRTFTRYFLKSCDAFITMSENVMNDLRVFEKSKPARVVQHPLYDNFGDPVTKTEARKELNLAAGDKIILFFGFIRKYKGLDILLEAMADPRLAARQIKLLVAGEFYEDEKKYLAQIRNLQLTGRVVIHDHFIPDSAVKNYLCAADALIQPYRNATQSGVTPLAYHFEKPMVVTNVGGLPFLVPHGKTGLVTTPDPGAVADAILNFYDLGESHFLPHIRVEKQKYSWAHMVQTITSLADDLS